jgi:predicted amidophosphoribosyltransferase
LPWSTAVRLGPWSGVLREAILEAKYARWRRLAFDLGRELGVVLARRLREVGVDADAAAVVPVPMSFRRRWSRGLDHTLAMARGVRRVTGCSILTPLRRRHRPPQASLAETAREANVRGCFVPRTGPSLARFPAVVVLDDVRTTGATLRAACRALAARQRRLGEPLDLGRVWVATLAVVTPSNRRVEPHDGGSGVEADGQDSRGRVESLNF